MRPRHPIAMLAICVLTMSACADDILPPDASADAAGGASASLVSVVANPGQGRARVPDQYIVVFKDNVQNVPGMVNAMTRGQGVLHVYQHALKGFAARLSPQAVAALQNNPNIAFIEQDATFTIGRGHHTVQASAPWHLDRIDQRDLPLSTNFTYTEDGTGVNIYIVDTGIRLTHDEFGGRASLGIDYIDDGRNGGDCHGHGTHVAGNAAGATFGVAKDANLISVRVANCSASGYSSNAVAAVDWITANAVLPAVANLSFGWEVTGEKTAVEIAVENSIAAGIFYAGATANARIESCEDFPSRIATLMTVARTDSNDRMVAATGFGACIDIFAPGQGIMSAAIGSDAATRTGDGTSYATPQVAGVAAVHLERNPTWAPAQVMAQILADATLDRIGTDTNGDALPDGTPDRLLFAPVVNTAPVAATGGPYSGNEGSSIAFNGSGSTDADGDALTYAWSFGDGGTGTGATPSHSYVDNGVYVVSLTVDDGLATHTTTTTATVANVAPTAIVPADASITSNDLFTFAGSFTDPGILDNPWSWSINWGDGSAATTGTANTHAAAISASHQFCAAGTYTVQLSVTDKDGGTGTNSMQVSVGYLTIGIMITPQEAPNSVSLSNRGLLPIAVLSSATFDATAIDPASLLIGDESGTDTPVAQRPNGRYHAQVEDVNGDGMADLVVAVNVSQLVANGDITFASTSLSVRGFLSDGCTNFRGTDSVRVVP